METNSDLRWYVAHTGPGSTPNEAQIVIALCPESPLPDHRNLTMYAPWDLIAHGLGIADTWTSEDEAPGHYFLMAFPEANEDGTPDLFQPIIKGIGEETPMVQFIGTVTEASRDLIVVETDTLCLDGTGGHPMGAKLSWNKFCDQFELDENQELPETYLRARLLFTWNRETNEIYTKDLFVPTN